MPVRHTASKPSLGDRVLLRHAETRAFDGLSLAVSEGDAALIFPRLEEALSQIKSYDRRRYDRLRRDLTHIWVRVLPGA